MNIEIVTPNPAQKLAIPKALKNLRGKFRRALIVLATGLGKTMAAAFIAKKLRAKRILFLVHNNYILKHALDEFRRVLGQEINMAIYNGLARNGTGDARIIFATWQMMGANLTKWQRDYFDLIVVDEAHHTTANTYRPTANYFGGAKLGITATPDRQDKNDIREIFGHPVITITLEEAIARGWLPRIEYHVVTDESLDDAKLQSIMAEIRESKKRFTMAEVNRRIFIKKRDLEIGRIINGFAEKAVVFCSSIKHAERMRKTLVLADTFHSGKCVSQDETWQQNQKVLNNLKTGILRHVCAVNAFNEGVDVPSVGLVAFCRVTEAPTVFRQQLGRGLRPGKDKLIVLDFVGNLERVQLVLEMMNKISDIHEKFTPRGVLEREGYIRRPFEVSGKGFEFTFSDEIVDLMTILKHCKREIYSTWQEASRAAISLGIKSALDYIRRYKSDPKLPCHPDASYSDFPGWRVFLGGKPKNYYPTWQQSGKAAVRLGIANRKDYHRLHKQDPRLPGKPEWTYADFPGWRVFLGGQPKNLYPTCQEASAAAIRLGFKSSREYIEGHARDPRLPSNPHVKYKDFPGWKIFLKQRDFYRTWQEASRAAIALKIRTREEYVKRYPENPRLPSSPGKRYPDFPGWPIFLGRRKYANTALA
ncbi:MAG: hypothetical protein QOG91_235 [Candidatus Parcubacteria bacterium]|nr:hypothetical protein [Candidatus Parcubacteria bacterium]